MFIEPKLSALTDVGDFVQAWVWLNQFNSAFQKNSVNHLIHVFIKKGSYFFHTGPGRFSIMYKKYNKEPHVDFRGKKDTKLILL